MRWAFDIRTTEREHIFHTRCVSVCVISEAMRTHTIELSFVHNFEICHCWRLFDSKRRKEKKTSHALFRSIFRWVLFFERSDSTFVESFVGRPNRAIVTIVLITYSHVIKTQRKLFYMLNTVVWNSPTATVYAVECELFLAAGKQKDACLAKWIYVGYQITGY